MARFVPLKENEQTQEHIITLKGPITGTVKFSDIIRSLIACPPMPIRSPNILAARYAMLAAKLEIKEMSADRAYSVQQPCRPSRLLFASRLPDQFAP